MFWIEKNFFGQILRDGFQSEGVAFCQGGSHRSAGRHDRSEKRRSLTWDSPSLSFHFYLAGKMSTAFLYLDIFRYLLLKCHKIVIQKDNIGFMVMIGRSLFDPLIFLERELRLEVIMEPNGHIRLEGLGRIPANKRRKAMKVVKTYKELLRLQLDVSDKKMRPSVQKLIAQGKIRLEKGYYVKN